MNRAPPSVPPAAACLTGILFPAVLLLAACGAEPRRGPDPEPYSALRPPVLHIGLDDSAPGSALGRVMAARVTEGGKHVVVLDFVAPYVKVFDAGGRFQAAFVARGGGPGEAQQPVAIAAAGDSLVLVADATQDLSVFGMDGTLRARARVPGLLPLVAAAPCPGEWLLYGPRREGRHGRGQASWLHRVRFTGPDAVEVTSMVDDTVPMHLPAGVPYGLVADGGGAVLRHTLRPRPRLLRLACDGGAPRVLHEGEPLLRGEPVAGQAKTLRAAVTPGMRAPAGIAGVGGGLVYGEKVFLGGGRERVEFTLLEGGRERTLTLAGRYVLEDSRPGVGVLMSTSEPVPQVFLLKADDFLAMFPER